MSLARIVFALLALIVVDPAIGMKLNISLHDEVDNRVIGGQDAYPGQFPHQVLLQIFSSALPPDRYYACGGTLIDYSWVLTAGHCLTPDGAQAQYQYVITAGIVKYSDGGAGEQIRVSTEGTTHPLFLGNFFTLFVGFDVGLIRLQQPFEDTYFVEKICYAPHNYDVHAYTDTGVISGWGLTEIGGQHLSDILQWEQVALQSDFTCFLEFLGNYDLFQYICVGEKGHTACNGDSGGPLTTEDARIPDVDHPNLNKKMVSGITSKGSGTCDTHSVYTRVAHYSQWIESESGVPPCDISY